MTAVETASQDAERMLRDGDVVEPDGAESPGGRRLGARKTAMMRWLTLTAGVVVGLCAVTASARASDSATITITYAIPFPAGPPNSVSGEGTFSTQGSLQDAGTVDFSARFAAVPSPSVGVLQSTLTLRGAAGTIELRCNQLARDFTDPTAVPDTGTCTIIDASGAYTSLQGTGKVTGSASLGETGAVVSESVQLTLR
jgi:hypothetical protein